jgi:hypothetical protein
MSYLIPADYLKQIQDVNLQQVISNNQAVLTAAERTAQYEAMSYLKQKYEVNAEFTDTTIWDNTAPYSAADRVYLKAPTYLAATTYNIGTLATYSGSVYTCNTDGTTGTFDPSKWDLVGATNEIYFAAYPFPLFDVYKIYSVGDKFFYNGHSYEVLEATKGLSHDTAIQYRLIQNIPLQNQFPPVPTVYKDLGAYTVPAGEDINNAAFWTLGDNRDPQMVEKLVDVTLYHVHSRIAPQNIPALRVMRYMGLKEDRIAIENGKQYYPAYSALGFFQACAVGEITPSLPVIQPKKGARIRFGGNVKNINSY